MQDDPKAYWNEQAGPNWVAMQTQLDRSMEAITTRLMAAAAAEMGERVVDIGCGCGGTTLALAEQVGPTGSVLGVDVSAPMLEHARTRSQASHVKLTLADAQTHDFAGINADLVFSRYGVMFFDDSTAAFANILKACAPGARCVFACWQAMSENPWMGFTLKAAASKLPPPEPPEDDAPGPFRFANHDQTAAMLRAAGFSTVEIEPVDCPITFNGSVEDIFHFFNTIGPMARAFAALSADDRKEAHAMVHAALELRHDGEKITWPSASFIVRATV